MPDSANYTAYAALLSESMSLLLGEEQIRPAVSKKTAALYLFPTPAVRQQVEKIKPFWIEALQLKAQIAASASAFDAAWEEVITAASIESEEGTREALAIAFQHKTELEALQKRLNEVAEKAKKAGELLDPAAEWIKIEKEHKDNLAGAKKALSKNGNAVSAPVGKGAYVLVDVKNSSNDRAKVDIKDGIIKLTFEYQIVEKETSVESLEVTYPQVIYPEQPVEIKIKLDFRPGKTIYFLENSHARVDLIYGAHSQIGVPAHWQLMKVWHSVPFHFDEKQRTKILKFTEDKAVFSLPDRNKLLQAIREKRKPVWNVQFRDQSRFRELKMFGEESFTPLDIPLMEYNLLEMYNPAIPADMKVLTMDSETAWLHLFGSHLNITLSYRWVGDGATVSPDDITARAKNYRVAEIEGNIAFIRGSIKQNREQLSKETDPVRRAQLQYEIMNAETEAITEEDMKKSILTGQYVHTRSSFDDFARGQFIEKIRTEQMRMEEFQRCSSGLQRLAGLLPPAEADQAREFISRQITSSEIMNSDVAKVRQIAAMLQKQVEARAARDVAKGEEEAAQVGLDWANRIKMAADGGMMATSLVAGPWLNVAYQGGTGAWDGGMVEGITRAASTYSMPSFLAVQAFQGYQAGGWKQAGENLAISYVTGKAIQFGLAKTITAAGKFLGNSSKETFELARFNQARQQGEALVKNLQRTEGEVIRLRVAVQKGERGAAEKLKQALAARESQTAAIHENMHAKNFLKYKGDYHTRKIFTEDLDLIHQKTQEKFHAAMQAKGWGKTPLKEFRNASSAGTSGMDYDIGLDEQIAGTLTKNGSKATLQQWQKEAQAS
ncbi:MAG TPA: hypothetical protein PLW67_10210, partial [Prolixibacteraceae bacterium]|nr:hypothetical protein [Prolixibacteraceae bacterium]